MKNAESKPYGEWEKEKTHLNYLGSNEGKLEPILS